jgi:hypothetical protein
MELAESLELIARFSRTKNFPRDEAGLNFLAEGLMAAVNETGAPGRQIVMVCAATSEWCPTDADLMTIARQIRDEQKRAQEALQPSIEKEWRQAYGPPRPFDWKTLDMEKVKRVKSRENEMLRKIKAKYPQELTWAGMIAAASEFGYEDYAASWEKGMR